MICKWNAIGYNRYQHQSNAYNAAIPPANIAMLAKHASGIVNIIAKLYKNLLVLTENVLWLLLLLFSIMLDAFHMIRPIQSRESFRF